ARAAVVSTRSAATTAEVSTARLMEREVPDPEGEVDLLDGPGDDVDRPLCGRESRMPGVDGRAAGIDAVELPPTVFADDGVRPRRREHDRLVTARVEQEDGPRPGRADRDRDLFAGGEPPEELRLRARDRVRGEVRVPDDGRSPDPDGRMRRDEVRREERRLDREPRGPPGRRLAIEIDDGEPGTSVVHVGDVTQPPFGVRGRVRVPRRHVGARDEPD